MTPPPPHDAYQIGWVCALPIEVAAAKQMLDEDFGILDEQDSTDTNSYTLGRVGRHYVVIAGLPAGQPGLSPATTVAVNMMRTFSRSLRIGLMVGIGGGIPSTNHDVRLGDIVVSHPEGTCGGVLQYDMGKVVEGGKFQRTGSLNSPPRSLLTAVANMKASVLTDDPTYPEYIKKATQRTARTRQSFGRPSASTDRLFKIEHDHPTAAAACDTCLPEWEEKRDARREPEPETQVFYGIIASGNAVMKHGATRELLRRETGALCFEMEAAGLMMDFPCIVVRGICDYADSHKNKQWQGYAALAAASYAKELLSYVPVGLASQEKLATDICNKIVDEVKEVNESLKRAFQQREDHHRNNMVTALTKEQRDCHQAFKTSTYEQYKNINPDRVEGTCRWILENSQYLAWQESGHNDLLWISADPGCGKSVLAKSLVDKDLKASCTSASICYFFFKDNDEQNNLATALCAVLHQLFGMHPHLLRHALPSWQSNGKKIQQESDELWHILEAATSDNAFSNTICLFDALDECRPSDRTQLIEKLEKFYTKSHLSAQSKKWLKFLVTSRPYDDIHEGFRPATQLFPYIHVRGEEENDQIHEEINLVVNMRVAKLGESLQLPPETQERLGQQLLQMEHRTYLWLHLVMDDIHTTFGNSLQPEQESIQLIPNSVGDAYAKILNRVPSNKVSDVRMILRIVVGARRPLTIEEMAMALGIAKSTSTGSRTTTKSGLNPKGLDKKIRRLCGLFVFINNSRVYLIHQTAREFLLSEGHEWFLEQSDTEALLSEICINHLLLEHDRRELICFLDYSAEHWADHVREMPLIAESRAETRINQIYDVSSAQFKLWYPLFWVAVKKVFIRIPTMNSIRLAAFNGHKRILQRLILGNENIINQSDEDGTNALHWACERGHAEIVQMLLDKGADVNAQSGDCDNALQAASEAGHVDIMQILLDNGADINAKGRQYSNALQAASYRGDAKIAQMLLDNGADVNAKGKYGNALQAASYKRNIEIVQMLLDRGADVDALHVASNGGNVKLLQMLLSKGAGFNAQGGQYDNPLQAASNRGHVEIIQMLLDRGADINAKGRKYSNALQAASEGGHVDAVQMLLDRGADINATGVWYDNALQTASYRGYIEIVQILLDRGADIDAKGEFYGNALQTASKWGHVDIVQMLLDNGADVNAESILFGNALQAASNEGHVKIVQMLLDRGADLNAQSGQFGNALQDASHKGEVKIVQMLLGKGADLNAQGEEYRNDLLLRLDWLFRND
ncbi:hypothetical protein QQS21_009044 [Conoideocrella luteorostrata]|uniref:Nucleoside phosphorylase domain-containing protein n=1 Tax=Conoideocrella luteorostrata TaxID=1105319 RepID=A0AAJ0CHY1_9HYPO|nr:hypothetical protein QQS21_009044 [Conoideocrella luteorostrata]